MHPNKPLEMGRDPPPKRAKLNENSDDDEEEPVSLSERYVCKGRRRVGLRALTLFDIAFQ